MTFYLLLVFAYAVGAIPFGLLLGRLFADTDIRDYGSGNIGATNVNRVLGRKLGAATLLCDVLKGIFCVLIAKILLGDTVLCAWVGLAAFIGHCFPIYLKFQGGKGVATAFGVILILSFQAALVALVVWILVVRLSKISSLGALVSSITIPFSVLIFSQNWRLALIFTLMMAIVVIRHRENIQRLSRGKEA